MRQRMIKFHMDMLAIGVVIGHILLLLGSIVTICLVVNIGVLAIRLMTIHPMTIDNPTTIGMLPIMDLIAIAFQSVNLISIRCGMSNLINVRGIDRGGGIGICFRGSINFIEPIGAISLNLRNRQRLGGSFKCGILRRCIIRGTSPATDNTADGCARLEESE